MNRTQVITRAFDAIHRQKEPLEIHLGDMARLERSVNSSVERIAVHSL
jgi:hypothetical protein